MSDNGENLFGPIKSTPPPEDRFDEVMEFFEKRLGPDGISCPICRSQEMEMINSRPLNQASPNPSLIYTAPEQMYGSAAPTITLACLNCQHLIPFSLYGVLRAIDQGKG